MDKDELRKRTKVFAHECVKIAALFPENNLGFHIERQLIRCSTSVAANYRAALIAHSTAAFAAKLSIVIEEVDECGFWIEFAVDENLVSGEIVKPVIDEASQLTAIYNASRKTIQSKNYK
ncbi:MAG: four helix bundle protein [Prolixibacteraceae bacterium]|nr:four helix bundle protein [Prolixibacteraceae bacterium]